MPDLMEQFVDRAAELLNDRSQAAMLAGVTLMLQVGALLGPPRAAAASSAHPTRRVAAGGGVVIREAPPRAGCCATRAHPGNGFCLPPPLAGPAGL